MPTPDGQQFNDYYQKKFRSRVWHFGNYDGSTSSFESPRGITTINESPGGGADRYEFVNNEGDLGAYMDVRHYPHKSFNTYPHDYEYTDEWAETMAGDKSGSGQIPLFTHSEEPAVSEVSSMRSTRDARRDAMNLLGVAAIDTQNRQGRPLTSDDSLSSHSMRLVNSLDELGVTKAPPNISENNWDFDVDGEEWGDIPTTRPREAVDPETVQRGINLIRSIARTRMNRKAARRPQGEQLQLDMGGS
jgi:hypothetical protein